MQNRIDPYGWITIIIVLLAQARPHNTLYST